MLSLRLKKIASMIPSKSRVIDIGCDHALLDIYLTLNNDCTCIAVDINSHCIEKSKENIEMYSLTNEITLILGDGLKNVDVRDDDYVVIAGIGSSNILKILDGYNIKNLIIQTNTDIEFLRKKLSKKYSIVEETVVLEKNIYYVISKFVLGGNCLRYSDIVLGKFIKKDTNCIDYRKYLLNKYLSVYKGIPKRYIFKRLSFLKKIIIIKKYC